MNNEIIKEVNRCLNCKTKPCQKGCPLGNDIPEEIRLIKEEKYKEAYEVLTKTTLLPAVCGKICPQSKQCQGKCTMGIKGEPIKIGEIEAWLGKLAINKNWKIKKCNNYKNKDLKVAIIGGGPAGLTCAGFLAKNGINVKIYEKHNNLGGLLVHGIPEFRLNREVLSKSIANILELGVRVEYNRELGKNVFIEDLLKDYDAVFLATGANVSSKMNIKGEELKGVYGANELLEFKRKINYKGRSIIIIGGGNVAIDVARTVKRKGAKIVKVIYRRSESEMPAEIKEIEAAKMDGIEFVFQSNVIKIYDDKNRKGKVCRSRLYKN